VIPVTLSLSMAAHNWEAQAQICRDILDKSIQKQWLLPADKLPSPERTNVLDVPRESGILTERELEITETDATGLVETMAKGTWTAEEVAIAFLKRATIGHQLVGCLDPSSRSRCSIRFS
jgi:amidase